MTDSAGDYHQSARGRRHSWYGTKASVKRVLSWRVPHLVVRGSAAIVGDRIRRERLPAPAHVKAVRARMAGVTFVMTRPDRCIIAKELYWGHGVRPRAEDQLALDVFAALARTSKVILDVGAYTGIFAILGAKVSEDAEVHAFEVVPEVAKAALDNVVANDLLPRITLHVQGVGKDGDVARISIGDGGSALPDFYSTQMHFDRGVDVPVSSLDTVAGSFSGLARGVPTVMKIDVEGTEDAVLLNGQDFLATNRPDILCEILPGIANVEGVKTALAPHGYRYYRVETGALTAHDELVAEEPFRDWLFTTKTPAELASAGIPSR
ncbi:FkbM family methyltransferase [Phytoactinopolyspora alkaliphila]|uniref:FkbM family methyltransferase n=1 Tax=Phytoactinopolyspora alkaliphila TaxID=1783498 RepID=A0A6N9YLH3_9ACTN|nr:FkbM family methyltransferase [Phytoactinopolyspora alkaliphila]NED95698.1 FkbM family methyltransferase [Phytoactinopolyspora alkaliphila]